MSQPFTTPTTTLRKLLKAIPGADTEHERLRLAFLILGQVIHLEQAARNEELQQVADNEFFSNPPTT